MRKAVIELINNLNYSILENWESELKTHYGNKLSDIEINEFTKSSLQNILEIVEEGNYSLADQYLIDSYTLFSKAKLNLLDVSNAFRYGRYSFLHALNKAENKNYNSVLIIGFVDEILEQIFARYSILYQNKQIKEIEEDRNRLAKKLDLNEQYLNTILYKSDTAIAVIDCNEKFVSWNRGAQKMFGYTEDEVIGKDSTLLIPDSEKYLSELEFIINESKDKGEVHIYDTKRKRKDGVVIPVRLKVTQMYTKEKITCGRTMIMEDLSQIKKMQQQINQSEKLAVIGQLAAGIAHEIGNPLTSISSMVQVMQRKIKEKNISKQLDIIKENINRISKIVRELVDFSRPATEDKELLQINDIVKTAVGIVKYDKRVKNVEFKTEFAENLPHIIAVPDRLLQVFVNILINALDAIDGNGKIEVKTYKEDLYVCTDIKDNGCGMTEEIQNKIFNPFFTTKEVGKGTGLGLSVSYGIIKKLKGKICVSSEPNEGTLFTVKLLL